MEYNTIGFNMKPKYYGYAFLALDLGLALIFHDEALRIMIGAWNAGADLGYKILGY